MEIILKEDVNGLGHKDEVVAVKNGYARNFLVPKGMAIVATAEAKKIHAETMRQRAHKEAKIRSEAEKMVTKLEGMTLKIGAKTSTTGKIFGSVTNIQIAEAIAKEGFEVERRNITVKADSIKEVGTYEANVKLYKDIQVGIKFEVVSE